MYEVIVWTVIVGVVSLAIGYQWGAGVWKSKLFLERNAYYESLGRMRENVDRLNGRADDLLADVNRTESAISALNAKLKAESDGKEWPSL